MAEKHHTDWKRSGGTLRFGRWIAPLLLAVIVSAFYWKLTLTNQFTWLANNDLSSMVVPWFQFQASEWQEGRFPLWDPYSWGGQPLLAQAQPGSAYPLNWLLFLSPLKHSWLRQASLHWYYVVVRILAALTMYAFCRDLGRSRRGSLLAGVVYGIAGYLGSVEWPQMVNGAVWVPLVFLFQFRATTGINTKASAALSGFFLGFIWLCGHHQLPLFVTLASICIWIYFIFAADRQAARKIGFSAVIALGLALLVSGFQTIPTAEYGLLARRWSSTDHALRWDEQVPYSVHEDYAVKPLSLLSIVVPGLDIHVDPLIGSIAFALAVVGLSAAWAQDRRVRCFAALCAAAWVFALGPNSIFHGLFYVGIPMIEKARVPAQALILFHLGSCALIAYGVDLFPALTRKAIKRVAVMLAALGAVLSLLGIVLFELHVLTILGDTRFMITAFACLVGAATLYASWRGTLTANTAFTILLGLVLLEVGNTSGYFFANYERQKDRIANLHKMSEDSDIVEFLRLQHGRFRVEYDGDAIPHNLGDWWGIETFTSYVASAPDIVLRNEPYNTRVQAMLGVRYYIALKPLRPDQTLVFTGASGHKVYQNSDALPRVWVVHSTRRVLEASTGAVLADPSINLRNVAIVTRDTPGLEQCSGDSAEVTEHEPDRLVIDAQLGCRGLIVLSETYFPGWRATVDGKRTGIIDADGMARGIIADRGKHSIEMTYEPASVLAGAAMTSVGTIAALAALIGSLRRKGHRPAPASVS